MSTPIAIIIVSFNTREITLDCLRTLFGELQNIPAVEAEVWVVDNASHDGSVQAIQSEFPDVHIIANTENRGFGAANNQAMREANGEYFLLLNSDAFVKRGAIEALIAELKAHPTIAIAGPRLLNADGSLQPSCWRFPSPLQVWLENFGLTGVFSHQSRFGDYYKWAHDTRREVDFVSGACFLVRRKVWEESGGFDESFALYAEETDWQKRLQDANWKIVFVPEAQVTHLGGASGGGNPVTRRRFFEGLDHYTVKHHGRRGVLLMRAGMVFGSAMRLILWSVLMLQPSRRRSAREKSRLHAWLLWRQATHWKLPSGAHGD